LAKRFQRRRLFKKSTDQKQELPVAANFVNGSEINEQTLLRTFQGCFLQNFDSFGLAVTENFFLEINQSETRFLPVAAMFVTGSGRNEQSL
jgi:hypothetical protein